MPKLETLLLGGAVLLTYWLLLFWMYRRKIFECLNRGSMESKFRYFDLQPSWLEGV
jgi:hypothetical protein